MITVDARCKRDGHERDNIYRMVGHCTNCGTADVLLLITEGHEAPRTNNARCPVCGCSGYKGGIHPDRLATADEIPVADR